VAETPSRTEAQKAVIRYAWSHFHATGAWPLSRKVEVELAEVIDREGGLRAVCEAIGRGVIVCEDLISPDAKVKLRIRGVAECPKTGQEVGAFVTLMRYAGVRYSEDTNAEIAVADFVARSGVDVDLATRAFRYAEMDGGRFSRGGGGGRFTLDRFARRLREVKTLEDLERQIDIDNAETFGPSPGRAIPLASGESGGSLSDGIADVADVDADAVTGLASRKALNAALPALIEDARSAGMPLGIVMADIDHFKTINDTVGHIPADIVLAETHACIDGVVRGKGRSYRFGGEEFVVVLPNHDLAESLAVAERVRRTIEARNPNGVAVTMSLGVVVCPEDVSSHDALLELADTAMYQSKEAGRNCVRAHGGTNSAPGPERQPTKKETSAPVTLSIISRAERMETDRHEYMIEVYAANAGASVLRDWTVEVQVPRGIAPPNESSMFRVDTRRDTRVETYRMTQEQHSGNPIFPGDDKFRVFNYRFVMTRASHDRGPELFATPVTAVLYVGDKIVAEAARPFGELQEF
jgi:diguanylate cyclase (GGDEF)-like protein